MASRVRVVVADDHAVVRAGIANALRELADLEIAGEAADGPLLLALLERVRPELLVTDVTMPDFEPIGTIREIRARWPALKILVLSAYDDDVYVQGLIGAGVDGYELKDRPLADLRLAVQRVLAGERWISGALIDKLVRPRAATDGAPGAVPALTARQREMLHCLHDGLDNSAIARRTGLSVKTVENHLTRLYREINVQSRLEAVSYVLHHPGALGAPAAAGAPGAPLPAPDRPVILVIDDNTNYRTQMRRMLGKSCPDVRVVEAENTQAALRLIADLHPPLVFADVVLGTESGIDCTRRIKALAPATRIVLISAYPDHEFHRAGLQAGAVAFLDKKDLSAAALREVVADLLGGNPP